MRKLSIFFDTKTVRIPDNEKEALAKFGFQAFFEPMMNRALQTKYPQGVPLKPGRILCRIQDVLDGLKVGESELSLEEAEFDFIKELFTSETTSFPPESYRLIKCYVESIEKAESIKAKE